MIENSGNSKQQKERHVERQLRAKSGDGRDRNRQKEEDDVRLDVGDPDVVGVDREQAFEIFDCVGRHRLSLRRVAAPWSELTQLTSVRPRSEPPRRLGPRLRTDTPDILSLALAREGRMSGRSREFGAR